MKLNILLSIVALTSTASSLPIKDFANDGREIGEFDEIPGKFNGGIGGAVKTGENNLFVRKESHNNKSGEDAEIEDGEEEGEEADEEVDDYDDDDDANKNSLKKRGFLSSILDNIKYYNKRSKRSKRSLNKKISNSKKMVSSSSTDGDNDNTKVEKDKKPVIIKKYHKKSKSSKSKRSNKKMGIPLRKLNKKAKREKIGNALRKSFRSSRSSL